MQLHTINVVQDFSPTPGGRFICSGPFSGESFREDFLAPAIMSPDAEHIRVELDGSRGYASCWLEEAFGGLWRQGWDLPDLLERIHLVCEEDPELVKEIHQYMVDASNQPTHV